jgi:glycerophosphoryl diester phosphodiesterase
MTRIARTDGSRRPLVLGHRGASAAHPENTVEAFVAARELGADGVELDVRATVDGQLVVHHDERLADGRPLHHLRRAQVPDAVPSLEEALDACAGMMVNVEVKPSPDDPAHELARRVADELTARRRDPAGPMLLVSSFDEAALTVVRHRQPELRTAALAFLVSDPAEWVAAARSAGHVAVNPADHLVDAALVDAAHAAALDVFVWTVDDPDRLRALAALGVDGVITNAPDVALAALRQA